MEDLHAAAAVAAAQPAEAAAAAAIAAAIAAAAATVAAAVTAATATAAGTAAGAAGAGLSPPPIGCEGGWKRRLWQSADLGYIPGLQTEEECFAA